VPLNTGFTACITNTRTLIALKIVTKKNLRKAKQNKKRNKIKWKRRTYLSQDGCHVNIKFLEYLLDVSNCPNFSYNWIHDWFSFSIYLLSYLYLVQINVERIIAVIDATFAVAKRKPEKSRSEKIFLCQWRVYDDWRFHSKRLLKSVLRLFSVFFQSFFSFSLSFVRRRYIFLLFCAWFD